MSLGFQNLIETIAAQRRAIRANSRSRHSLIAFICVDVVGHP
jgi:hypothetical protein